MKTRKIIEKIKVDGEIRERTMTNKIRELKEKVKNENGSEWSKEEKNHIINYKKKKQY